MTRAERILNEYSKIEKKHAKARATLAQFDAGVHRSQVKAKTKAQRRKQVNPMDILKDRRRAAKIRKGIKLMNAPGVRRDENLDDEEEIDELRLAFWRKAPPAIDLSLPPEAQQQQLMQPIQGNPQAAQPPEELIIDEPELLTTSQKKRMEKQQQKAMVRAFKEANPHVLARLKQNMDRRDWAAVSKMIAIGAFWGAATYAAPWFFLPAGAIIGYKRVQNRRQIRKNYGIKSRVQFKMDTGYQKGSASAAFGDLVSGLEGGDDLRRVAGRGYAKKAAKARQAYLAQGDY